MLKVPTTDTGTAISGIIDARRVCRNRITTSTTSTTASSSVCTTARMESRTNTVIARRRPLHIFREAGGQLGHFGAHGVRQIDGVSPGDWKIPIPTASLLLSWERSA